MVKWIVCGGSSADRMPELRPQSYQKDKMRSEACEACEAEIDLSQCRHEVVLRALILSNAHMRSDRAWPNGATAPSTRHVTTLGFREEHEQAAQWCMWTRAGSVERRLW